MLEAHQHLAFIIHMHHLARQDELKGNRTHNLIWERDTNFEYAI